jgi:hypothetical protein
LGFERFERDHSGRVTYFANHFHRYMLAAEELKEARFEA